MSPRPGQNLLHYRLVEKIGEGGMGVVWKAVDTNLNREVAIKVLPDLFSNDAERLTRFEREARLLATLSHTNIATVHGLHQAAGVRFLAMELAAGNDLTERITQGPIPVHEALTLGLQLTEALEAAHERGVIHRDLKPANIRVDAEGNVKVLDFGLAKAFEGDPAFASTNPSLSPTLTSAGTLAGAILGTAAYMSSEQAKGKPVDKRADVWAFGCVLYEMLTGRLTFPGETVSETLAAVIKDEPDWSRLPSDTPSSVRRLLRRCLHKDVRQRLRDIGDARIVISETLAGRADEAEPAAIDPTTAAPLWTRALPWGIAGVLGALLIWSLGFHPDPVAVDRRAARFSMVLSEGESVWLANHDFEIMPSIAVSPAGDRVVYVSVEEQLGTAKTGGLRSLRSRSLNERQTQVLQGTDGAEVPFFSPDGQWVGFFKESQLMKVPAHGGATVKIADTYGPGNGGSWGTDDRIVFARSYVGPLWVVPAAGGEPRELTTLAAGERNHRYPQLLPDGKSVLFTVKLSGILSFDDAGIAIADLETGKHSVLSVSGTFARYLPSGHLVYARDGGLLAAPFDLDSLTVTGGAVPVLEGLLSNPITGSASYETSRDGTLVYVPGSFGSGPTSLVRIDRQTGQRELVTADHFAGSPHLHPDEKRIVMHGSAANDLVLVLDLERGTVLRMSDGSSNSILPIWGPKGEGIVYTGDRSGSEEIVWLPADGAALQKLVDPAGQPQDGSSWSPDGTVLAINRGPRSNRDIWMLDLERGGPPKPFLTSSAYEGEPVFSPDGQWIVYTSDESGVLEVYARTYPGPGGKVQVSNGGGFLPRWRGDGREVYYQDEEAVYAVPIAWGPGPQPGRPERLFEVDARLPMGYDVTSDGRWFYVVEIDERHWKTERLDVVLNWFDELERLVPGSN
jgi:serine/threonine-protein kinase